MEKLEFSGKYFSFQSRLIKDVFPIVLIAGISFFTLIAGRISQNKENKLSGMLILILIFVTYLCIEILRCKNLTTSVAIDNGKIGFTGFSYNKKWEKEYILENVKVSIKSQGKTNKDYFLSFSAHGNKFVVNKLKNWDYIEVVSLFRAFKAANNDRIIFDDEYWLDVMEKKARGMTSYQAIMSKGNKNAT